MGAQDDAHEIYRIF